MRERVVFLCQQLGEAIASLDANRGPTFVADRMRRELREGETALKFWSTATQVESLMWGMEALLNHYKRELEGTKP